jgi:hypothetical protein
MGVVHSAMGNGAMACGQFSHTNNDRSSYELSEVSCKPCLEVIRRSNEEHKIRKAAADAVVVGLSLDDLAAKPSLAIAAAHPIHYTTGNSVLGKLVLLCGETDGGFNSNNPASVTCVECKTWLEHPGAQPLNAERAATCIAEKCDQIKKMLLEKNAAYGNSAFHPQRIFSKLGPEDRIRVRLDDKLARIVAGNEDLNEDAILDTVGYLVLLLIQKESGEK